VAAQEEFAEPLVPELSLTRKWTVWEHYDAAPGIPVTNQTWTNWQKIAWFGDIITFWQLWHTMPFSKLEKYFYDKDTITVPVYNVGDDRKRINTFSVFETGI
jgi:hypothetical protein